MPEDKSIVIPQKKISNAGIDQFQFQHQNKSLF